MAKEDIQRIKQRFGIVGNSSGLNRAIDIAMQVAPTDISVLITGESGVGKESFPQIIHLFSPRKHGHYIAVNCGAIPEGTIDSELFGHEKGSFTGALNDRKGYFEEANNGTIFLDEVGELPLSTQARLLRVLESGEYIKVGSSKVQKTNVRIVAATNLDVQRAVAEGRFREDLYYRLNSANIHIPPLRERPEDVYMLFRKFAGDCADKYRMPPLELQDDARKMLEDYDWPGNIRQLKNIAEQISVIETNREITADTMKLYLPQNRIEKLPAIIKNKDQSRVFNNEREILYQVLFDMRQEINDMKKLLHGIMNGNITADFTAAVTHPADFRSDSFISAKQVPDSRLSNIPPIHIEHQVKPDIQDIDICEENVTLSLHDNEKEMIKKALLKHGGKRKNAAHDLKISERTLYRKIKEYELENN